jgi:hypothetical protein
MPKYLRLVIAFASALAVAGCGDDSVNPSVPPEAGAAKDAAPEGGEAGQDGGGTSTPSDGGGEGGESDGGALSD